MGSSSRQFNSFRPASVSDYANTPPQSYASTGGMPPQQNYKQPMPPSAPAAPPQMGPSLFNQVSGGQMANINDPAPAGPAPWQSGGFGGTSMPQPQMAVLNEVPQQGQAAAQPNMSTNDLMAKLNGGQQANINDPAPTGPAPWMSGGAAPGFPPGALSMESLPMQPSPQAAPGALDQSSLLNAINAPQSATLSPGNMPTPSVMPASQPTTVANGVTKSPAFTKTRWR